MGKLGGLVALGLIALTGCSASAASGPAPTATAVVTATATITAAPIEAKPLPTSSATMNSSGQITGDFGDAAADDFYLRSLRPAWRGDKVSDAELIAGAKLACEKMADGENWQSVSVITGDIPTEDLKWNNNALVRYASQVYCVAYDPSKL